MSFHLNVVVETNDAVSMCHSLMNVGFLGCFSKLLWGKTKCSVRDYAVCCDFQLCNSSIVMTSCIWFADTNTVGFCDF
jgi:hypothetical protein